MNDQTESVTAETHNSVQPFLQHHFDTPQQQYESGKQGMWVFLATEILFFSGLFVAYTVYRAHHPEIFIYAHQFLDKTLGAINTVVLICSSLTMAWAVRCAQISCQKGLIVCLSLTLIFAFVFLGIKFVEYKHKWEHGLRWGKNYTASHIQQDMEPLDQTLQIPEQNKTESQPLSTPDNEATKIPPSAIGPTGLAESENLDHPEPNNVHIFFGIYFAMTGLHGLHVLGGIIAISWLLRRSFKGDFNADYFTPVDLVGLYWHLVDLIWIYLFPMLYLIG